MLKMRVLCGGGPKVLLAQVAVLLLVAGGACAWGGRFNRFNPTALNSYGGYGGAGGYQSNYGKEKFGVEEKVRNRAKQKFSLWSEYSGFQPLIRNVLLRLFTKSCEQ